MLFVFDVVWFVAVVVEGMAYLLAAPSSQPSPGATHLQTLVTRNTTRRHNKVAPVLLLGSCSTGTTAVLRVFRSIDHPVATQVRRAQLPRPFLGVAVGDLGLAVQYINILHESTKEEYSSSSKLCSIREDRSSILVMSSTSINSIVTATPCTYIVVFSPAAATTKNVVPGYEIFKIQQLRSRCGFPRVFIPLLTPHLGGKIETACSTTWDIYVSTVCCVIYIYIYIYIAVWHGAVSRVDD